MRSPNLFVVLAAVVSASSACSAQPTENLAENPPVVVLRGASAPSEPWTSAPVPVYNAAPSEASYLPPYYAFYYPYYYFPYSRLAPRHKHAGASHHHK
jgi:hypothetical protein